MLGNRGSHTRRGQETGAEPPLSKVRGEPKKNRLSANVVDYWGAGVPPAQQPGAESGRRDACNPKLAESRKKSGLTLFRGFAARTATPKWDSTCTGGDEALADTKLVSSSYSGLSEVVMRFREAAVPRCVFVGRERVCLPPDQGPILILIHSDGPDAPVPSAAVCHSPESRGDRDSSSQTQGDGRVDGSGCV